MAARWVVYVTITAVVVCLVTSQCLERENATAQAGCGDRLCFNGNCTHTTFMLPDGPRTFSRCLCDPMWKGSQCDKCCHLECEHGNCYIDNDDTPRCACYDGWTGTLCERSVFDNITCNASARYTITPCLTKTCYHGNCSIDILSSDNGNFSFPMCECDPGWRGLSCDQCCDLQCNNGSCDFHDGNSSRPFCYCIPGYMGESCLEIRQDPTFYPITEISHHQPIALWYVVGFAVGLLVLLVAVLILLPYYLYRKRYLFITRIVYKLKNFEEDDKRPYDAFVSYRTSSEEDRKFVAHTLFPKLEQEAGFKLCIDQRDFIAGAAIVDNILEAIAKSKRSILVLSPNYCESEWAQFEYQRSQMESMRKQHRIIPILFRDVDKVENMDKNLKHIMETITYIKWPERDDRKQIQQFWDKVTLAMPKLKERTANEQETIA